MPHTLLSYGSLRRDWGALAIYSTKQDESREEEAVVGVLQSEDTCIQGDIGVVVGGGGGENIQLVNLIFGTRGTHTLSIPFSLSLTFTHTLSLLLAR